jgi:NADH-quinone oxidoreductase subunit C
MTNETAPAYPGVSALVHKHLPKVPFTASQTRTDADITVEPANFLALVEGLKNTPELGFDYLRNVVGIDMEDAGLACKYQFYSMKHGHAVQVTVPTPPGNPHIPSLAGLYDAADWHEREAAEMLGLVFDGHPNLKNLLLDEDVRIHPLLKAHPLQKMEIAQGIEDRDPGFKF